MMTDPALPTHDHNRRPLPGIRTAVLIAAWIASATITAIWATSLAGGTGIAEHIRVFVAIAIIASVAVTAWWSLRRSQDRIEERQDQLAALIVRSEVRSAEHDDATRSELVQRLDALEAQRPDFSDGYERGRSDEARVHNAQRGADGPPTLRVVDGSPWRR